MRLHPTGKFDNRASSYRHIEARPLAAAMGAEICGVNAANVTEQQFQEVRSALFRHKMIYLRNQKLTHADQETFSLRFGPFAEDAYTSGVPGHRDVHDRRQACPADVRGGEQLRARCPARHDG